MRTFATTLVLLISAAPASAQSWHNCLPDTNENVGEFLTFDVPRWGHNRPWRLIVETRRTDAPYSIRLWGPEGEAWTAGFGQHRVTDYTARGTTTAEVVLTDGPHDIFVRCERGGQYRVQAYAIFQVRVYGR